MLHIKFLVVEVTGGCDETKTDIPNLKQNTGLARDETLDTG